MHLQGFPLSVFKQKNNSFVDLSCLCIDLHSPAKARLVLGTHTDSSEVSQVLVAEAAATSCVLFFKYPGA